VAEGDVEQAADPRPGAGGELLGGAAHQCGRGDDAERRGAEDHHGSGVRQLEHDRDPDERDEQVGPALAAQQEAARRPRRGGGGIQVERRRLLAAAVSTPMASIATVRRPLAALLAATLAVLLCPAAAGAAPAGPTVPAALDALLATGAIDQLHHDAWAQD